MDKCSAVSNIIENSDYFITKNGIRYAGTHLILDLWGAKNLDNLDIIEKSIHDAIKVAKATLLHINLHHFEPNGGISGVAVLAESHISIHTWPEYGYAALDLFMCGHAEPHKCLDIFKKAFHPERIMVSEQMRGGTA